jgi:hypothetical protein
MSIKFKPASFPLAHIPRVSKCDTVLNFHMTLKFIHGLENQPSSLVYRIATGDLRPWLLTQVALDVVYYLRRPREGLLLLLTYIEENVLSLLVDKGKGL